MKPEHFKEFNAEHAKAGAPYGQRNGLEARIGIWDVNSKFYPLSGVRSTSKEELACSWTEEGRSTTQGVSCCDLVMLPLGYCEGVPVFVDDLLKHFNGVALVANALTRKFDDLQWPRTAPVMPKSSVYVCHDYEGTRSLVFNHAVNSQRQEIEAYWKALDKLMGVGK